VLQQIRDGLLNLGDSQEQEQEEEENVLDRMGLVAEMAYISGGIFAGDIQASNCTFHGAKLVNPVIEYTLEKTQKKEVNIPKICISAVDAPSAEPQHSKKVDEEEAQQHQQKEATHKKGFTETKKIEMCYSASVIAAATGEGGANHVVSRSDQVLSEEHMSKHQQQQQLSPRTRRSMPTQLCDTEHYLIHRGNTEECGGTYVSRVLASTETTQVGQHFFFNAASAAPSPMNEKHCDWILSVEQLELPFSISIDKMTQTLYTREYGSKSQTRWIYLAAGETIMLFFDGCKWRPVHSPDKIRIF